MAILNSNSLNDEQRKQVSTLIREWKSTVRPVIRPTEFMNEHDLVHTPSILGDDVSVGYYLQGDNMLFDNSTAAVFLNNALAGEMGLDSVEGVESLREFAYDNMAIDVSFTRLSDILGMGYMDNGVYVLSNDSKYYGAAAIEVLDRAMPEKLQNQNFYMLPSSVHEVLVLDELTCTQLGVVDAALAAMPCRAAVAELVDAADDDAARAEVAGQVVVAADVLDHPVDDLDDGPGPALRRLPNGPLQDGRPVG